MSLLRIKPLLFLLTAVLIVAPGWGTAQTIVEFEQKDSTAAGSDKIIDPLYAEQRALELLQAQFVLAQEYEAIAQRIQSELTDEQVARFIGGRRTGSGAYVDEGNMQVTEILENSPAHTAGVVTGDVIVEINGVRGGDSASDRAALFWAYRRLNPGDTSHVTVLREGEEVHLEVPVLSSQEVRQIRRQNYATDEGVDEQTYQRLRREGEIYERQWNNLYPLVSEGQWGAWDGLLMVSITDGLQAHVDITAGVLVVACEDQDHPLQPGDVITRVGHQTPADAKHAVQLLYDYDSQERVPLAIARGGHWLELEMDYPKAEILP